MLNHCRPCYFIKRLFSKLEFYVILVYRWVYATFGKQFYLQFNDIIILYNISIINASNFENLTFSGANLILDISLRGLWWLEIPILMKTQYLTWTLTFHLEFVNIILVHSKHTIINSNINIVNCLSLKVNITPTTKYKFVGVKHVVLRNMIYLWTYLHGFSH